MQQTKRQSEWSRGTEVRRAVGRLWCEMGRGSLQTSVNILGLSKDSEDFRKLG